MLNYHYYFIDEYIDRSDFELFEMDTYSNYFAFSEALKSSSDQK
jgi:hypothetical protein